MVKAYLNLTQITYWSEQKKILVYSFILPILQAGIQLTRETSTD